MGCGFVTDMHSLGKLLLGMISMPDSGPSTEDAKTWVPTPALGDLVRSTVLTHCVQRLNSRLGEGRAGRATRGGGRDRELPAEAGAQIPSPAPTLT